MRVPLKFSLSTGRANKCQPNSGSGRLPRGDVVWCIFNKPADYPQHMHERPIFEVKNYITIIFISL